MLPHNNNYSDVVTLSDNTRLKVLFYLLSCSIISIIEHISFPVKWPNTTVNTNTTQVHTLIL